MLDRTAVHEAGHAVAAHALGFKVLRVSIVPEPVPGGAFLGSYTANLPSDRRMAGNRTLAERYFLCTFAGPVAEVNLFGLGTWVQHHVALWHEQGDFGGVRELLEHHAAGNFNGYFQALIRRTGDLLAIRRGQIVAVAAAVMRERELDAAGFLAAIG